MTIAPGTQLGAYEIVAVLGSGGMGEVYRARDLRLNREVALKIIHPALADAEHLTRFRREAQVLAALNHPHVAAIYELDDVDGTIFLVMELVPGDTLRDRIARGPLQVAEALAVARQIADALDAAHERGIVHRDLKPANIKVTPDGVVKVLDFGLAKAALDDRSGSGLTHAPTVTTDGTRRGLILGTAAYMSPEQARGNPLDRRTDIWAFGCVVYEMLTGRIAFAGETMSDTIATILDREPDWSALPAATPAIVTRLLRRCLQKDFRQRLRDIGDARFEIEDALNRPAAPGEMARSDGFGDRRNLFARAAGLLAVGGIAGAVIVASIKPQPPASTSPPAHFMVSLPSNERLAGLDFPALALAPDGSLLAYVATRGGGQTQLFLRPMNSLEAAAIPGTTNAIAPFFSPDSRWVAFFADGQLKKVSTSGGAPVTLCEAPVGFGGSWVNGDTIVFAAATGSGLSHVSAAGGKPQRLTNLDAQKGEFSHRWPDLLPDGKTVIYTVGTLGNWDDAQIVAQSLTSGRRSTLVQGGTNPHYLPSGHLIYARGGAIMAVPFDSTRLTVTGTPVRVLDEVLESFDGAAQLAVSRSGSAVYVAGASQSYQRRLVAVDRTGTTTPFAAPPRAYASPRLSPDGRKLLVTIAGTTTEDLWMYDITSGALSQITFDASTTFPIWTPDGQRATFSSNKGGAPNLFWTPVSEQRSPERLATSDNVQLPGSWSPDGRTLAFVQQQPTTGRDIQLLPLSGERTARPFLNSPFDESAPRFSPDGRWMAYVSNESGRNEVYLRGLAVTARAQQVSSDGGTEPVWARDGRELFYRAGEKMMAVSIGTAGADVRAAKQETLFEGEFEKGTIDTANYDVTADQRFIMIQPGARTSTQATLHVLLNWFGAVGSTLSKPSR